MMNIFIIGLGEYFKCGVVLILDCWVFMVVYCIIGNFGVMIVFVSKYLEMLKVMWVLLIFLKCK